MKKALGTMSSYAVRWFQWRYSMPKVAMSTLRGIFGWQRIGTSDKPLVMTCSISEDYARAWLFFLRQRLAEKDWDVMILDSAGDMNTAKLKGSSVIRLFNWHHGVKIDMALRKMIQTDTVFLCDDDMYLMKNLTTPLELLQESHTPIVSLFPRDWWTFDIQGQQFLPMGSFALLFKRQVLLQQQLKFASPTGLTSPYRVMEPGVKPRWNYDTADYMNEQLLLKGFTIPVLTKEQYVLGFKGLSDPRKLLMKYGKREVEVALQTVNHYKKGSVNGAILRSIYSIVKFEQLYQALFREKPAMVSGFTEQELRKIIKEHSRIDSEDKRGVNQFFDEMDEVYKRLINNIF